MSMRSERLLHIMGQIDPELVVMADEPVKKVTFENILHLKKVGNTHVIRQAGLVASLILLLCLGGTSYRHIIGLESAPAGGSGNNTPSTAGGAYISTENGSSDPAVNWGEHIPEATTAPAEPSATIDGLPVLTMEFMVDGMGYEGYMAHSFDEIKNANPWSEDLGITHLPVFRNSANYAKYDADYQPTMADMDALKFELATVMKRFGVEDQSIRPGELDWKPALKIQKGDISFTVDYDLTTTIRDEENPATLPAEFEYTNYNMPYEKYQLIGEYLKEEYADFIDMENPCINVFGGDYNIYDDQDYQISFYDACEDPVQRIINYNFNGVQFYLLDGTLDLFRVFHPDLSDVVGNYPIISAEEAKALLIDHVYATTVPYDFPGEEYIRHCELVYRDNAYETYFLPYYRFYVELPQEQESEPFTKYGLNTYGAYYVPAVEGKYIENMPVWELRFN